MGVSGGWRRTTTPAYRGDFIADLMERLARRLHGRARRCLILAVAGFTS
jgi:hypothetical protein